jgi:hypothetical protein
MSCIHVCMFLSSYCIIDHEFRSTKFLVQIGWQMTHQELYVGALLDRSLHDLQQGAYSDVGQKVNSGICQPIVPVGGFQHKSPTCFCLD